jgi:hypothetical protein
MTATNSSEALQVTKSMYAIANLLTLCDEHLGRHSQIHIEIIA